MASRDSRVPSSFSFAAPLSTAGDLVIQLLFERYYAAGLGRFRISVTADPQPVAAREMPPDIDEILLTDPERRTLAAESAASTLLPDGRARARQGTRVYRAAP